MIFNTTHILYLPKLQHNKYVMMNVLILTPDAVGSTLLQQLDTAQSRNRTTIQ